jgi:hypothetical protein
MSIATMMAADIDATAGDLPASIVVGDVTVAGTCSPAARRDEVSAASVFEFVDQMFVAKATAFTGGIPAVRVNVVLTCADLGITSVRYFIDSRIVDPGGVTLTLRHV